ncbi:hypothetical protein KOR34_33330 [Posidoniimonas corsicana]|uniref:Uncharacterized protein n=1 Tax=Posidoniimonas corsicana TaxID=1938618 RepID=A0A5C5V5B2_9BACT|nr:hypothetical protein [Posidoniimonas corsicana]TWT33501.1 hypothetical protein KOR34_33330 [Posidoniimonas corsicana]
MLDDSSHRFVADGPERYGRAIRDAHLPGIEAAVLEEYQLRLNAAGVLRRWLVRLQIRAEIERRLAVALSVDDAPEPSPTALW